MDKQSIILVTHGHFEKDFLLEITDDVKQEFLIPVSIRENNIDLSGFYDEIRRQYDGNKMLKEIDSMHFSTDAKKIGLYRVDLFIPILTYIFGQAIYKGNSGIASLYRLKNEQYGMTQDEDLLFSRFRKVIIHELGHTFGLKHCYVPTCVMRSSTYVEDIDQKWHQLCSNCRDEIGL